MLDAAAAAEEEEEEEVVVDAVEREVVAEELLDRALDHLAAEVLDQVLVLPVVAVRVHRQGHLLEVRRRSVIQVARTMRKLPLKLLDPTLEWDNVLPQRLENFLALEQHRATLLRKGSRIISRRAETTLS